MRPALLFLIPAAFLAGAIFFGCQTSRSGYKSAPYKVVRSDGKFEVRDYPAMVLAATPMAAQDGGGSFGRLFGFITGHNQRKEKIAMTTPVFMEGEGANREMAFVMPADLGADRVPSPADQSVAIREMPAGRFAVLRFSGGRSDMREAEMFERLKGRMTSHGMKAASFSPIFGYFDPPWTPPFMRRNEVMLPVEK